MKANVDSSCSIYGNEMDFKKGDEITLEGERTEAGWLHCLNKTRNTRGWVHERSLINVD